MENSERRQQLEALLQEDPQDTFLRYALALELAGTGDRESAVSQLATLLAHSPDYVPAYLQVGKLSLELGREDAARQWWQQGILAAEKQRDFHAADEMRGMLHELS